MKENWAYIAITLICAIILIVYLIRRNLKDKTEVTKSLSEQFKQKQDTELSDDDEP